MIGFYLKTAVLQGASRRTQLKSVAVPNNAVPNRGLISNLISNHGKTRTLYL